MKAILRDNDKKAYENFGIPLDDMVVDEQDEREDLLANKNILIREEQSKLPWYLIEQGSFLSILHINTLQCFSMLQLFVTPLMLVFPGVRRVLTTP